MHPVFPKIGNFLLNKRYYFLFAFALLVTGGALFFIPNGAVHAQLEVLNPATWAPQILGSILSVIITGMGVILINIIYVLLVVAQYNTFINSTAVSTGWVIMRDICNMFFVLALLVIAVGTILQQEQYSYKKLLPNFIIMAVMVNFSKTICGVIIDFANVIMATFVAALAQSGGGGFAALLGIPQMMKLAGDGKVDLTTSTVGLFSAFLFMGVALIVMTYAVWALVLRIIALWFLIVLSPLAFTVSVLPEGKTHWNRWWKEFSENVIMGPVLAFFLWLSLAVVSRAAGNAGENAENVNIAREFGSGLSFQEATSAVGGVFTGSPGNALASGAGHFTNTAGNLAGYLLGIGMLIGSLVAASEIGGAGGKFAGKGAGYAQDWLQGKKGISIQGTFRRRGGRMYDRGKSRVQAGLAKLALGAGNAGGRLPGGLGKVGGTVTGGLVAGLTGMNREDYLRLYGDSSGKVEKDRQERIDLEKGAIKNMSADELNARLARGGLNADEKAAHIATLAGMGKLDTSSGNKYGAAVKDAINATRGHLKGTGEGKKLDEVLKKNNQQVAFETIYGGGASEENQQKIVKDISEGKVPPSMLNKLDAGTLAGLAASAKGEFLANLAKEIDDPKEIEKIFGQFSSVVKEQLGATLNADSMKQLNPEQQDAAVKASGNYEAFTKNKTGALTGTDLTDGQERLKKHLREDQNKKAFVSGSSIASMKNKDVISAVQSDEQLKITDDDVKLMSPNKKSAFNETVGVMVQEANAKAQIIGTGRENTYDAKSHKAEAGMRQLAVKSAKGFSFAPPGGTAQDIMDLRSASATALDHQKEKEEAITAMLKKISGKDMVNLKLADLNSFQAAYKDHIIDQISKQWSAKKMGEYIEAGGDIDLIKEVYNHVSPSVLTPGAPTPADKQKAAIKAKMEKDDIVGTRVV